MYFKIIQNEKLKANRRWSEKLYGVGNSHQPYTSIPHERLITRPSNNLIFWQAYGTVKRN
jgi:hypothetical protein